jgi:hypothetical protein
MANIVGVQFVETIKKALAELALVDRGIEAFNQDQRNRTEAMREAQGNYTEAATGSNRQDFANLVAGSARHTEDVEKLGGTANSIEDGVKLMKAALHALLSASDVVSSNVASLGEQVREQSQAALGDSQAAVEIANGL